MASAAAVAANEARSPLGNDIGEDNGYVGEVTSGIYSKEEGLPDVDGGLEEDEDEDDLPTNPLKYSRNRASNGDAGEDEDEDEPDLFGDEEEEEQTK